MDAQYCPRHMEMALRTAYRRGVAKPDGYGRNTGDCGDTIEIFLVVRDGLIEQVYYLTNGCLDTNACANAVVQLVPGKSILDAWHISSEQIIAYLKTLDSQHYHCAELAVGALYHALTDAHSNSAMPWKKLYRTT